MGSVKEALNKIPRRIVELFPRRTKTKGRESLRAPHSYFDRIGRPDLKEVITSSEPWSYWTAELYGEGIKGQGGLGMLASDTLKIAAKLKIPMVCVTNFYTAERSYEVGNFEQKVAYKRITPEERGFSDTGIDVTISTLVDPEVKIDIYEKKIGSVTILAPTEPNLGELYEDRPSSDRRLYQDIVLGFGGYKGIKACGLKPSMNQQLNEAPTVFSALARLDDHLSGVKDFKTALADVRRKTIYTNHSNVPAAEAEFTLGQFEHFVMPNIKNEELKTWLRKKIEGKGGKIYLSTLAIELSGKKNGVSKAHAKDASNIYKDYDGQAIRFDAVTNGIAVDRWGDKVLLDLYRKNGVLDEFDLPTENYKKNLDVISEAEMIVDKYSAKERLREYLLQRKDQYGKPVDIARETKIFNWRRRLADYKRPEMLFENPEILGQILDSQNADLIIAGNVHPTDTGMAIILTKILKIIDGNEILKKRVHFIQDYDEDLGKALSQGSDVSINTPKVKDEHGKRIYTEACGTSWMKDILNNTILISTDDGGVADLAITAEEEGRTDFKAPYLQITGRTYREEVISLYNNLWKAAQILDNDARISWGDFIKRQTSAFLPTISGARMEKDYIDLAFPIPTTIFTAPKKASN